VTKYLFSVSEFQNSAYSLDRLRLEIYQAGLRPVRVVVEPMSHRAVTVMFPAPLSGGDEGVLRQVVAAHIDDSRHLPTLRALKMAQVDTRTRALIQQGFVYGGKTFSLSENAQRNIMGMDQVRDDPAFTYPVRYNTIDDQDVIELSDAASVHSFFLAALGTYRAHLDGGVTLKDSIRTAPTIDAVKAITDPR